MPFMGQDWRSPGEVWVKTVEGWEPMKLLRKSHLVRHQTQIFCSASTRVGAEPEDPEAAAVVVLACSSLSSSPDASPISSAGSGTDSDSELESSFGRKGISEPVPVPVPKNKVRHQSGDSGSSVSSTLSCSSPEPDGEFSMVDIIERLQRSSSQPIPIDILRESSEQMEMYHNQPYYRITMNPTREVQGSNIISDAFYKLDFCNAIRDIRRFAYVSKLLHLLITQNLTSLSGNATKALFWMLEEIAKQVASNKQNIHVIRGLLVELREIVDKYLCWGRPLGSTLLWEQHLRTMERICEMTDAIEIVPPEQKPAWSELPEELIREILLRLADYKDLERSAQACQRMNSLLNEEQRIWKQLVKYHFTKDQLNWAQRTAAQQPPSKAKPPPVVSVPAHNDDTVSSAPSSGCDWEQLFHLLRKKFGLKEEYADCLFLCRYCRCLFWKSKNHPCILENPDLTRQVLVPSAIGFTTTTNQRRKFLSGGQALPPVSHRNSHLNGDIRAALNRRAGLPGPPVMVQNMPLFEHPLVVQRLNQHLEPIETGHSAARFQKAPLHVPITPQAFLKFFSL